MKLQSVIDDNQLIAEFMGATSFEEDHTEGNESYCKEIGIDKWLITIWTKPEGFKDEWGWGKYKLGKWEYSSSWDWLMPVVEKIESLNFTVDIQNVIGLGQYCRIYSAGADVVTVRDYETKIKAVYKSCIEFIKWYNKSKNN